MSVPDLNFRYFNREGRWLDFAWEGMELRADGSLALASLPALAQDLPAGLSGLPDPSGPSGIAVGPYGDIYSSLPDENRVVDIQTCYPFASPRGLVIARQGSALLVCDSGNHRIQILDLRTAALLEIWDGFDTPVAIEVNHSDQVFVGDRGAQEVTRRNFCGEPDPNFKLTADVVSLAAYGELIYVLDAAKREVLVFDENGQAQPGLQWTGFERPMGLAVTADSIYVGDNGLRRVLRFRNAPGYPFVGDAAGYEGPVAAIAIAANGDLLVQCGADIPPVVLHPAEAFVASGTLTSAPINVSGGKNSWHTLHASLDALPDGAHFQFFVRTSDNTTPQPFPSSAWTEKPRDRDDFYIGGDPARYLWIVGTFSGNGSASPVLRQLRARFDQKTYFPLLPSIYDSPTPTREFFARLLALFESFNVEDEDVLARLPELFDPDAIPPAFLLWIASWIAADVDQRWDIAKQRQAVREAYQRDARRGTVAGLKEAVAFETGVNILIEEPISVASWWALPASTPCCGVIPSPDGGDPADASLGVTTMLAGSFPEGAVVGSTTVLDHVRILAAEDLGLPLFDEVAHRFCVYLYPGAQSAQASAVAAVLDREKPAHTTYHLCTVEPRMSVGFQARVGIDTVVGGPRPPTSLGSSLDSGGLTLGPEDRLRIGVHSRIGDRLHL